MIEIDGAAGEGGGQVLRSALALAMCTGQGFAMTRIRAGRAKPGLMRQHLTCVQAAVAVSGAVVDGAELGSTQLRFQPGAVRGGDQAFQVGTAGSCTLVLQTVWPALMLADQPSQLRLGGGTHNPMAPPYHFLERSYAPLMRRLGAPVDLQLRRLGFFPAGGGEVAVRIEPAAATLQPYDLMERGALREAYAECYAAAVPRSVARRELDQLGAGLGWSGEQLRQAPARHDEGPGNVLMATLDHASVCEVFTQCGERGLSAETVARRLVEEVQAYQAGEGALGPCLADQWMLPLALAVWLRQQPAAYTCTEITPHASTHLALLQRFLPLRGMVAAEGRGWCVRLAPR